MQERPDRLEQGYENLVEQIRLANQERFGRKAEKLDEITDISSLVRRKPASVRRRRNQPWKRLWPVS